MEVFFFFVTVGMKPFEMNHSKTRRRFYSDLNTKKIIPILKTIMKHWNKNTKTIETNTYFDGIENEEWKRIA